MPELNRELKPCPFCGGVAELHTGYHSIEEVAFKKSEIPKDAKFLYEKIISKQRKFYYKRKKFIPRCVDASCVGRTTHIFWNEEVAINAWNRRDKNE
jgi:hypothetical protein